MHPQTPLHNPPCPQPLIFRSALTRSHAGGRDLLPVTRKSTLFFVFRTLVEFKQIFTTKSNEITSDFYSLEVTCSKPCAGSVCRKGQASSQGKVPVRGLTGGHGRGFLCVSWAAASRESRCCGRPDLPHGSPRMVPLPTDKMQERESGRAAPRRAALSC